eukprot:118910-Chlamydomonas_euryale.AAC.1
MNAASLCGSALASRMSGWLRGVTLRPHTSSARESTCVQRVGGAARVKEGASERGGEGGEGFRKAGKGSGRKEQGDRGG